eukprot:11065346-Heterocapsa_arctica.AAC.1
MAVAETRFCSGVSAAGEPAPGALPGKEVARAHAAAALAAVWRAERPPPRITNLILEEKVPEEKI